MYVCVGAGACMCTRYRQQLSESDEGVGFNGATVTGNGGPCDSDEDPMQKQSVLLTAQHPSSPTVSFLGTV